MDLSDSNEDRRSQMIDAWQAGHAGARRAGSGTTRKRRRRSPSAGADGQSAQAAAPDGAD
jgi:poly(A) polymerase